MADPSISELTDRVRTLERDLEALRSEVARSRRSDSEWVESLSGSMKDFPDESYDEIMAMGRAIVAGEQSVSDQL